MNKGLIVALIFCLIPLCLVAEEIIVKRGDNQTPSVVIVTDDIASRVSPRLVLDCQFSKLEAVTVPTERGNFTLLTIPKFHNNNDIGDPRVPMMIRLLELPFGATPNVRVVSFTETEYTLKDSGIVHPLMPCQGAGQRVASV